MPLREPVLLLSRGFLFTRTTMARLDLEGGFAWLARLRSFGPIAIPRIGSRRTARNARPFRPRPPVAAGGAPLRRRRRRAAAARSASAGPSGRTRTRCVRICAPRSSSITTASSSRGRRARPPTTPERRRLVRRNRERRAGGHRSAAPARVPLHVEPFRVAADPWHLAGAVPAGRAHARQRGLAGRGGRPGVPVRRSACSWKSRRGSTGSICTATSTSATAARRPSRSCSPRSRAAKTSSSSTTEASGCCRRSGCAVTRRLPGSATTEGDAIRFGRSQAALLDALLAAQPAIAYDETFARVRVRAADVQRHQRRRSAAVVSRDAARVSARGARLVRVPAPLRFRRLPGRRHGPRQDRHGAGAARRRRAQPPARRTRRPSLVVVPRSLVFNWTRGGGTVRAEAEGPRLHRTGCAIRARSAACDLVLTTYGTLRRDAAVLHGDRVRLRDSRRGAGDQERGDRVGEGGAAAARAPPPGAERHADREPSRRAVEPVRVPESGTARIGESVSARELAARRASDEDLEWLVARAAAVHPAPDEGAGRAGAAAAHRADAAVRARRWRSGGTTTSCARTTARRCSRASPATASTGRRCRSSKRCCGCGRRRATAASSIRRRARRVVGEVRRAACRGSSEVIDEGHKALVFSQFTSLLALLRPRLDALGMTYEYLDGRTRDRAARVERFQSDPACRLFLISLKAGGLGLEPDRRGIRVPARSVVEPGGRKRRRSIARTASASRGTSSPTGCWRATPWRKKWPSCSRPSGNWPTPSLSADAGLVRTLRAEDLELLLS